MHLNGIIDAKQMEAGETLTLPDAGAEQRPGREPRADAGPAPTPTRRAAKTPETPERAAIRTALKQPVDPVDHILLKPTTQLTMAEAEAMIGHPGYWPQDGDPRGNELQDKTRDFFERFYDGEGKIKPNESPRGVLMTGGIPIEFGRNEVGDALGRVASNTGLDGVVRGLQQGLNEMRFANDSRLLPDLAEDADFGPRNWENRSLSSGFSIWVSSASMPLALASLNNWNCMLSSSM